MLRKLCRTIVDADQSNHPGADSCQQAVKAAQPAAPSAACLLRVAHSLSPLLCLCSGVEVEFPYDAYPCQLDYMTKVVQALQQVGGPSTSCCLECQ